MKHHHDVIIKEQIDPTTQKRYWKADPGRLGDDPDPDKKVNKGDTIHWQVGGSAVTLFFPDETIFGTSHVKLLAGEDITLEVRRGKASANVKEENLYAAFCHEPKPGCFAEGDSSPIIIVE